VLVPVFYTPDARRPGPGIVRPEVGAADPVVPPASRRGTAVSWGKSPPRKPR